jgi:hypothetical protein
MDEVGKYFWNLSILLLQIFIFTLVLLLLSPFSLLYRENVAYMHVWKVSFEWIFDVKEV